MGENHVDIDPAALNGEADALRTAAEAAIPAPEAIAAPGAPGGGGESASQELTPDQVQALAAQQAQGLVFLSSRLFAVVAPNWKVTPDESREVGEAAAVAMAAWFPSGAIPYKYMVLLNLGGAVFSIADRRRDANGDFLPLKPAKPVNSNNGAPAAA